MTFADQVVFSYFPGANSIRDVWKEKAKAVKLSFVAKRLTKQEQIIKSFDKDWAAILVASEKGSFFYQEAIEDSEHINKAFNLLRVDVLISQKIDRYLAFAKKRR